MKINEGLLKDSRAYVTADDYGLPDTLGNAPRDVRIALDACFAPARSMLSHALSELTREGLPVFAGYGVLTGLAQNGLIRAGVETRADEMTREWGQVAATDANNDIVAELENDLKKFKISEIFNRAACMNGYYGGCLYYIDTGADVAEMANPLILEPATFPAGSLKGFRLIEPFLVTPGTYNAVNPMKANYFKPDVWYVQGVPVHASRFLYFAENTLPSILKPAYNFFGMPLAQKVLDAVSHYTACRESAARLLQKYALTVFKTDMSQVLSGGMDTALAHRVQYFVQNRDNDGCATIDKENEDIVVMTTSLSGVTDLVRQAQEYVAAMFNEPVTKMWGLSPNGFSSGESDMRSHYDNIASLQHKMFDVPMARVLDVLQMNRYGAINNDVQFVFKPLSPEDNAAKDTSNKSRADRLISLVDADIIAPEEARQALIDDKDSGFNGLAPYSFTAEINSAESDGEESAE